MKEEIRSLTEELFEHGAEDDLAVLHQILTGLNDKNKGKYSSYVGALLNMQKECTASTCTVTVPISKTLFNSLGIVHGGMTATVIDSAMGTLANLLAPEGFGAVTSQLNIHYIHPVNGENMTAAAQILHQGRNTMVVEGYVLNAAGKRVAHATGSFYLIEKN
ncbi:PaaI family thioesterase [Jeotgalibacillus sp. S-D1]|uniref:PaaI family thioesterase n=1 Tax=Jeotgalibacillus sp. S-D1 TaxID=2552189 RepID=UPI0010597B03|nr:PaaI family thioesterase [Jeotgalibacillus sp. S-D1]TDL35152.1 PaaI family thioesterase [Jeotgalibacillus sp. S-D1]